MALIALLFAISYLSYIALSLFNGVLSNPYYTCACIAPTIKFFVILDVTPPPLIMNGTSYAFVFSAFFIYLFRCSLCDKSDSMIFPRYLYLFVRSISLFWYLSVPGWLAMYCVLFIFSCKLYLFSIVSSVYIIS